MSAKRRQHSPAFKAKVALDDSGRYVDNLFIERLWRTVKYEEIYLKAYQDASEARGSLAKYITFDNLEKPHQSLKYKTPAEEYGDSAISQILILV